MEVAVVRAPVAGGARRGRKRCRGFWSDAECTQINLVHFFGSRLFRLKLGDFLSRPAANRVHFIDLDMVMIPMHVQNLLAKSLKYVPAVRPEPLGRFLAGADSLVRSAAWFSTLGAAPSRTRHKRFSLPSSGVWPQLSASSAQALGITRTMIRDAFVQIWKGSENSFEGSNFTPLDRRAMVWLQRSHSSVRALDTDKNLGLAIAGTSWVLSQVQAHLSKNFSSISVEEAGELRQSRFNSLRNIVHGMQDTGIVDDKTARFLLSNAEVSRYPNFRIIAKVHKNPISSRPIVNLSRDILGPLAIFLNHHLLEVQKSCAHVVLNSTEVVKCLESRTLSASETFVTFDVETVYPSLECLERDKCVGAVVSNRILKYFLPRGQSMLADFLIRILWLLLSSGVVQDTADGSNTLFKQTSGLTTGLAASSTIANIYLAEGFDKHIVEKLPLTHYSRYIDDGVGILDHSKLEIDILGALNSWHPSIRIPEKDLDVATQVHFLDLQFFLTNSRVAFRTYRKPQAIFDYIPPQSAHDRNIFSGLVAGECTRMLITNTFEKDYKAQLHFFRGRLARRGHSFKNIDKIMCKYPWSRRQRVLTKKRIDKSKQNVFGHGIHYFPGIRRLPWHKIKDVERMLTPFTGNCKVRTFFRVRPNLFLKLYSASWRPKRTCLVAG